MPLISLTFFTASEFLTSSSSTFPHHLNIQHRNALSASHLPQQKPPLTKSDKIAAAVLWLLLIKNPVFYLAKKLSSPTGITWESLQCVRCHQNAPEGSSRPFKVMKLVCAIMINIMPLYVGTYDGS